MVKRNREKYYKLMNALKSIKSKDRDLIIQHLDDQAIDDVCECVYNVIYTDLNLSKATQLKIKRFIKTNCSKNRLKVITNKRAPLSKRKAAIRQEGGNIFMLIARALPFLYNTISSLIPSSKDEKDAT